MPADLPTGLTNQYAEQWDTRWKAYLKREHMHAAPDNLSVLIRDLREFLVPLTVSSDATSLWSLGGPWATPDTNA